ncbi:SWIM zinc finger family protein [Thermomonospora umbrina]|uniref:SWIM zinc finger protein n=1 Tax=Thermomonospora umbrina TaxID=111806 RepID=A0A3D9SGH0_9ACTN|nr:SWIM zinc finger family protein [Thermomonospora umbrina]REE95002.1 SWIM zinc finger protein [Thermomonospora umbrina]
MSDRWGRERVLALAPDPSSARAAGGVAKPAEWLDVGCDDASVWGECRGGGTAAYRACVDLAEPAFRCSCPSRKFPCKHALGLLLLWSDGTVDDAARPPWVAEWLDRRAERAAGAQERGAAAPVKTPDPKTVERRRRRVDDGVAELAQWLRDQVGQGLAQAERAPYKVWDDAARRLVDAQAPGLAGQVKGLSALRHGDSWPDRLLEEYALLALLARAHRRAADLPEPLRATVRSRVGFTVTEAEVLATGERVRDEWYVAGSRDTPQDQITARRVWLRGVRTGRPALVLFFAAPGRVLDASFVAGATVDAELAFYPGARPLRAAVAERHGLTATPPGGCTVGDLLREYADALALDPWLDRWPAVLADVRLATPAESPVRADNLHVVDDHGDVLPLRFSPAEESRHDPWRLLAVSGGDRFTLAGEWSPRGLQPLSAWHPEEGAVVL